MARLKFPNPFGTKSGEREKYIPPKYQDQMPQEGEVVEPKVQAKPEPDATQQHIAQYQTVHHHHYYGEKKSLKDLDISYRHEDDEPEDGDEEYDDADQEERERKPRYLGPGCNPLALLKGLFTIIMIPFKVWGFIRSLIWLIVFLILALIFVVVFKPAGLWNPLKNIINGDIHLPVISEVNSGETYLKINDLGKVNRSVSLNESEFTSLVRSKLQPASELRIGFEENLMKFYYNIDNAEMPLWLVISFKVNQGSEKLEIAGISIGSIGVPEFFVSFLSNQLGGLQGIINNAITGNTAVTLINQLLDEQKLDDRISLKTIVFEKEKITLNFSFDSAFNL
ncbi:MAG TPA: hypothetical protein VJC17_00385 [Candidatus Dojkabacteria bacterium]|nr:hypothetical protein [Candidatus Dojkabacteria bacterium]